MTLRPRASRLLAGWWVGLHALLAVAALLVGWPWPVRLTAVLMVLAHGVARRPRRPPRTVLIGADAWCAVPDWRVGEAPLGSRTIVCPYWVRLEVGIGLDRRHLLLCADQIGAEDWTRLRALLERARSE